MNMVALWNVASETPVLPQVQRGTEVSRKAAEIVKPQRFQLGDDWAKIRELAPSLIEIAFRSHSQHRTCVLAAQAVGISDDKVLRILSGDTQTPDLMALCRMMPFYHARTGKPHPIACFLIRVMQGGAA
jgi:hypothetical protein